MAVLEVYKHSLADGAAPTNQDLITQLRFCLPEVICNDCSEELRNPATIAITTKTSGQVKEVIISHKRNLKKGELDKKKRANGTICDYIS
jgi:hypothetical protein